MVEAGEQRSPVEEPRRRGLGGGLFRLSWEGGERSKELLFDGCLTSQQHASVSQGRICSDVLLPH